MVECSKAFLGEVEWGEGCTCGGQSSSRQHRWCVCPIPNKHACMYVSMDPKCVFIKCTLYSCSAPWVAGSAGGPVLTELATMHSSSHRHLVPEGIHWNREGIRKGRYHVAGVGVGEGTHILLHVSHIAFHCRVLHNGIPTRV